MLSADATLHQIQTHFASLYTISNNRFLTTANLAVMLQQTATYLLKGVRKEKHDRIVKGLIESFGWTCAIASRLDIDLQAKLFHYFPGVCPYCNKCPCEPALHVNHGRKNIDQNIITLRAQTLQADQVMFATIYPNNTLQHSAEHTVEEASEVAVEIFRFESTHDQKWFNQIGLELSDVVANLFGVANCAAINVGSKIHEVFGKGCPGCGNSCCTCNFGYIISVP